MINYVLEKLKNGEVVIRNKEPGNSMTPILKSRQPVDITPVTDETVLIVGDIVYCKVKGCFYTHKIAAICEKNGTKYLISNNHGHENGWIRRKQIFGVVTKIWDS